MTEHEIFSAAIKLSDVQQLAFLDAACGQDIQLRQQVDALLKAHNKSEGLLTQPIANLEMTQDHNRLSNPGTTIAGRYKLLEVIGEGGMGSVWVAEQKEPIKRKVAIKLIKAGMDSKQVLARFEAERQALALMDHPNISRVFDGGMTEQGRPYFVMEYVKGIPLTEYCDQACLSLKERLELFIPVCHAVQHAHQKGIIHRDLKPSNILVCLYDGKPVPKVIDFGLAKAIHQSLTEQSLYTAHGMLLGTPLYMSPEQAEHNNLDVDTRTDIYSLGVILYELLTGSTPLERQQMKAAAFNEILRLIKDTEPPKPSSRLSSSQNLPSIAAQRRVEPNQLKKSLSGDLDWIVMKALDKERSRRFETANGLARDIARYLNDEAVEACPPSAAYRFKKLVRRNKGLVTAACLIAATLVVGIVGTTWGLVRAERSRQKAINEAERATLAEAESKKRANELKEVADFQGRMLEQVDPAAAGVKLTENVRTMYDAALVKAGMADNERSQQIESFANQWSRVNATDAALDLIDLAILKPTVTAIDEQFSDQPAVAATLRHVLAERYHDLGLDSDALTLQEQALAQRRKVLGEEHPDTLESICNLGVYISSLGRYDEAKRYYVEAIEKSRKVRGNDDPETLVYIANLGMLKMEMGQLDEAEVFLREALEARRKVLGEEHPDTLTSLNNWASLQQEQGKLLESEQTHREILASRRRVLGELHHDTLSSINNLAVGLRAQGKLDESIKYLRDVVEKKKRVYGEMHPLTLSSIQSLGSVLGSANQKVEAEGLMREALAKQKQLLGSDHTSTLATMGNLSVLLIEQDKFVEAEPMCRETLERRKRVLGENHTTTLIANNVMGLVLIRQNKLAEGEAYWQEALKISQSVLGPTHPETLVYKHNLAALANDQGKMEDAERLYREVCVTGGTENSTGLPVVLSATRKLSAMLLKQERFAEAEALLAASESAARKLYTGSGQHNLAALLRDLAMTRARLGQFPTAEVNVLDAHAIFERTRGPEHRETRDCTTIIADFYSNWDQAEPGKGHDKRAAEWKAKLDAITTSQAPSAAPPATTTPATAPTVTPA